MFLGFSAATHACSLILILLFHIFIVSTAVDTITTTRSIKDGNGDETLVSGDGNFELGFFSAGQNSSNRYLGIWYKKIPIRTVVWVANRATPLTGTSGVLKLTALGYLTLLNRPNGPVVWSSKSSEAAGAAQQNSTAVALLLGTGNLVVRDETRGTHRWESFNHIGNTFLPGMKSGKNLATGLEWYLSSWKSDEDPAPGDYTITLETQGLPQRVIWKQGSIKVFRSGPWNGIRFSGTPLPHGTDVDCKSDCVFNDQEAYCTYSFLDTSVFTRFFITPGGAALFMAWSDAKKAWVTYGSVPTDSCDKYGVCGPYGSCHLAGNVPRCECLTGFVPKSPELWARGNTSDGCVRKTEMRCPGGGNGFLPLSGIKMPDAQDSWCDKGMNLVGCRNKCLENCSCTAYSSLDISSGTGTGCLLWFGELMDIRVYPENGQEIYIKMASADIGLGHVKSHGKKRVGIATGCSLGVLLLGLAMSIYFWRRERLSREGRFKESFEDPETNIDIPFFNYPIILNATQHFSADNKLGEGGFGPVYKGRLEEEQDIAVKILSEDSKQGLDEFKNEVLFIAKLQHRNLVKLLGCCIQEQKMLVYEYMPNRSLDYLIFDEERSKSLDWPKRLHIINGIARGLLYLHEDSNLRLIHRDLKASNILLDHEMNPKISDFGLATHCCESQNKETTKRVVGTYGYMSPEYAVEGFFSIKSDVFSFGVIVLEMISGKRNWGFKHPDHDMNLLGHAWKLYMEEGRHMDLVSSSLAPSCCSFQVSLLIHLGLLCVQPRPDDRPSIARVIQMMGGESELFPPKQPGILNQRSPSEVVYSSGRTKQWSTITVLEPR